MSKHADRFVRSWVSKHIHNIPGLDDCRQHVEALAERLKDDARAEGIDPLDLEEGVGDLCDYLLNEYEQILNPELGFKDRE